MPNYFIVLDNHTDISLIKVILMSIPWIKSTFDTIVIEGMSKNHTITEHIETNIKLHLLRSPDIPSVVPLSNTERELFLPLSDYDRDRDWTRTDYHRYETQFVNKMNVLDKVVTFMRQNNAPWELRMPLEYFLFSMKCIQLTKLLSAEKNIKFVGTEPDDSYSRSYSAEYRSQSMIQVLLAERVKRSAKNVFFLTGTEHGIQLLEYACRANQGGFQFCRVIVDHYKPEAQAPFMQWHNKNVEQGYGYSINPGYGNSFEIACLGEKQQQYTEQALALEFQSLYRPWNRTVNPIHPNSRINQYGNTIIN